MRVLIDPGHSGKDPGAIGNGLQEKNINMIVANYLKNYLFQNGFDVIMTRVQDVDLPLSKRILPCDVSISIHTNSGGGQGFEVWHSIYNKGELSKKLAKYINNAIIDKLPDYQNRGLKTRKSIHGNYDYLYMLRQPKGVPILVECGFIDNSKDAEVLKSTGKLKLIAEGICRGLKDYRALQKK